MVTSGALWIFINYMQRIYDVLQQNMNLFGVLQDSIVGVGIGGAPDHPDTCNRVPV